MKLYYLILPSIILESDLSPINLTKRSVIILLEF